MNLISDTLISGKLFSHCAKMLTNMLVYIKEKRMEQVLERHSVSDAKENLSGLIAKVEASGTPFVISRYGKPVAIVASYNEEQTITPRLMGSLKAYANKSLIGIEKQAWKKAVCGR